MRTRAKGNVIDASTEPLGGAVLDNSTLSVLGGITIPDGFGVGLPAFMVLGDQARLFPIGRTFVISAPSANAGTYTVVSPGGQYFKEHPPSALPYHINDTTEIPTSPAPASAGTTGVIPAFGIAAGGNFINDLLDPTDAQDCATKNYVDTIVLGTILPILNSLVKTGSMVAWTSDVIPTGWYLCNGSSKTVAGDGDLHGAIGYEFGGAGVVFSVPDMRGRFPMGLNPIPIVAPSRIDRAAARVLGGVDGFEEVSITSLSDMAVHSHTGTTNDAGVHSHSGSTSGAGGHKHGIEADNSQNVDTSTQQGSNNLDLLRSDFSATGGLIESEPNHNHNLNSMSYNGGHVHTMNINNTGSGSPHENTPPYQVVNYIIKR